MFIFGSILYPNLGLWFHICLFARSQLVTFAATASRLEEAQSTCRLIFPKLVVAKWSRDCAEFGDHLVNPPFAATFKVEYRAALSFFKKFEF